MTGEFERIIVFDIIYIYVYYTCMPNKTIYVSDKDEKVFEEAQKLGDDALSAVIVRALKEFVARNSKKGAGMSEIKVRVGSKPVEREQRFMGKEMVRWSGTSDDKVWWMEARVYTTQKGNWAVLLTTVAKTELLLHGARNWMDWADSPRRSELLVAEKIDELKEKVPANLLATIRNLDDQGGKPEFLDI